MPDPALMQETKLEWNEFGAKLTNVWSYTRGQCTISAEKLLPIVNVRLTDLSV